MSETNHWTSKSMFLENVTGSKIIEEQDKINCSDNMFVVATTPILLGIFQGTSKYDAFVYYKVKPEQIKKPARKLKL